MPWTTGDAGKKPEVRPHKVAQGVPFYARPICADYGAVLASALDAGRGDHIVYTSMEVYYNRVNTIEEKRPRMPRKTWAAS